MPITSDILVVETGKNPVASVIWSHGLGADKHDFESIIPMLELPDTLPVRFIFPNAPIRPITVNGGMEMRGWYDIRNIAINEQEDIEGIAASAKILSSLVDQQVKQGIPASRIILAGFSQGGAMALYQGLRQSPLLAGIIGLSCYLPLPNSFDSNESENIARIPVFLGHGNQDPVVPVELGIFTRDLLRGKGIDVQFNIYSMGHSVSAAEIADIGQWLKRILNN